MKLESIYLLIAISCFFFPAQSRSSLCTGSCDYSAISIRCEFSLLNATSWDLILQLNCFETGIQELIIELQPSTGNAAFDILIDLSGFDFTILSLITFQTEVECRDTSPLRLLSSSVYNSLDYLNIKGCFDQASFKNFTKGFPSINKMKLQYLITSASTLVGLWDYLPNLVEIELTLNEISRLDRTLFQGLNNIQQLILNKNSITSMANTTFLHLSTLQTIELDYNNLHLIHDNQFYELSQLQAIHIQHNELTSIPNSAFEQLTSLIRILLTGNPINCICDLAWVSVVSSSYGIDFGGATCKFPSGSKLITSNELYTNCPVDSQECFDPTINCQFDCINTVDSFFCECPIGYGLTTNNRDCTDSNECGVSNGNCLHSCVNTEGSFHCTCNLGYQLSLDKFSCEDINECLTRDAGCLYGCINAIGSHYCRCLTGHNSESCVCESGTDYCVYTDSCLTDLSYCCPHDQYYCSVTECCVDNIYSCPPTLPEDTSSPVVMVGDGNQSPLVVSILALPSFVICEFKVTGVSYTTEYQQCEFEWQNCITTISTTSPAINYTILSLTDFRFSRCLIRSTSDQIRHREFIIAPHFQSGYIAARSLASNPAIAYVLAGDLTSYCPDNCPSLNTDLILVSDPNISLSSLSQVTIETQECVFYDSIYWWAYSLYKLKINFIETSVLFQGDYTLHVQNTEIGSTSLNISFSYPSNAYCPAEFEYGVLWDVTLHGVPAAKLCSELLATGRNSAGLTRMCSANGEWSVVHSDCHFPLEESISKILIKVVLTVSQESYFSSLSRRRREVSCPQPNTLLQKFQDIFSNLNLIAAERVGYFDTILMEIPNSLYNIDNLIQSVITPQLLFLVSANCYSQYWISEINQNFNICACASQSTEENSVYLCAESACNCTDSGCQCKALFAGDGTFCGPDSDSDNIPVMSLPCSAPQCSADNCNRFSNPSQEDCNTDGIGDVCQDICFAETDQIFDLSWPCTLKGDNSSVICTKMNQEASRNCKENDLWSTFIDTFNCTSPFYDSLNNLSLSDALRELALGIRTDKPVYSGDITISVELLEDNLNRTEDPNETEKVLVINDTLLIIDQLIDEEVIDVLTQSEIKVPVAEKLIRIVDTHAISIVSQNTSVRFENFSNLYFETIALSKGVQLSEPITITARNLDFNTKDGIQMPEITLPTNTLSTDEENIGVVFFAKKNIGSVLFKYGPNITVGNTDLPLSHFSTLQIVSPLISAQIIQGKKKITKFENATVGIKLPLTIQVSANAYSKQSCVAITLTSSENEFSTWFDEGLSEPQQSKGFVDCESMHLTSFAILAAVNGLENQEAALTIVSYVGVGVSIVCLTLCIYIYLAFCQSLLKQAHHYTHFNLILSLLLLYVIFSIGLELPYRENFGHYIPCKVASAVLQYLVLCLFAWMLAEGIIIFILMQWPFYHFTWKYALISTLLCWIIPGIYVAIYSIPLHNSFLSPTAAPINNARNSPGFCWIQSRDEYMYVHRHNLVVIVPIIAIIFCNVILFLFVITKALLLYCGQKSFDKFTRSRKASLSLLRLFVVLTPALGFLWILGLVTLDPSSPFAWVFTIVGSLQGLFILLFVVLVRKDIRDLIVARFARIYSRVTSMTGQSKNTSSRN